MSKFSETDVYEAIARGWCQPNTQNIEMDAALADAIAAQVLPICRGLYQRVEALERERDELLAENRRLVERAKALEARLAKYQVSIEAERERWHRGGIVSGRGPIKTLQAILEEPAPTLEGFDEAVVQVELLSQGSDKDAES